MFDDKFFDDWLDTQAQKVMGKVADGEGIAPEQMMILMLKAQTNHFAHLDIDLRNEMILLRIPVQRCHLIQAKAATHSTAKLPPIPVKVATL
jgi:hypothetical protein